MHARLLLCLLQLALVAVPFGTTTAAVYLVRSDGTGDFPTIQAAANAMVSGDVIELDDGVFIGDGNRDVEFPQGEILTIRSRSGNKDACIVDCQGAFGEPRRAFRVVNGVLTVEGLTIRNGYRDAQPFPQSPDAVQGGAIYLADGQLDVFDVSFEHNRAEDGAAIYCQGFLTVDDCLFVECQALDYAIIHQKIGSSWIYNSQFRENNGGGGYGCILTESTPRTDIRNCLFEGNYNAIHGAAIGTSAQSPYELRIDACTFRQNLDPVIMIQGTSYIDIVNSVFYDNSTIASAPIVVMVPLADRIVLDHCTFARNTGDHASCLYSMSDLPPGSQIVNSIFAFNRHTTGCIPGFAPCPIVHFPGGGPDIENCDIYGNEDGDWIGVLAPYDEVHGNISADPLFCALEAADLHLAANSPCLSGNMGALEVGCGPFTTENDWAAISAHITSPTGSCSCNILPFVTNRTMLTEFCSGGVTYPFDCCVWLLTCNAFTGIGVSAFEFGVDYAGTIGSGVDVNSWVLCADQEFTTSAPVWPQPGSGIKASWDAQGNCQDEPSEKYVPHSVVAIAGVLDVTVWSRDQLCLTPHPMSGRALVVDCNGGWMDIGGRMPSHLGIAGFCMSGWNPCGAPTPVRETTWGQIKQMYLTN